MPGSAPRRDTLLYAIIVLIMANMAVAGQDEPEPILEGYHDYRSLRAEAHALADEHDTVAVRSLGTTLGGRGVGLLTLAHPQEDPADNPAVLIIGQEHAPHLVGSELALRIAGQLAEQPELLRRVTFYIILRPSPDAAEAFFTPPYYQRTTNKRPTDDDNDGLFNEDGPNDLNEDGYITQLRIAAPAGDHTPHPEDNRIMIEAGPDTPADRRYRLITEAKDDDGDGLIGEDGPGGVAFDRNFTFAYPYFERGAGPHQVSEVETRAVADFAFDHPNIALVFTFSPRDNLMHPWEPDPQAEQRERQTTLQSADQPYYQLMIARYAEHQPLDDLPPAMEGGGDFVQWAYFHFGRFSLAARAWWVPQAAPPEGAGDWPHPESGQIAWLERAGIEPFVDWQPIDHPDLVEEQVEVGGFKPFIRLNPPADLIDRLARNHAQYLAELAEMLPRVVLRDVRAEPVGDGLVRVQARVVNQAALPTVARMGEVNGIPEPLRLRLTVADDQELELLTGAARISLPPLRGNGGSYEQAWLIRTASESATIEVNSPAVQGDRTTLDW